MENLKLQEWVNQFTDELFNWAYYKTSSVETAKDLVQDTFLAAAEKIGSFKEDSSPKTWLFAILNHKIIDYYKKAIHSEIPLEDTSTNRFFNEYGEWKNDKKPEPWIEDQHLLDDEEFQSVLQKCLDALPEKWSLCVKLKYLSEKNGEEICQEMGIATTNLWQIIHRAKLQLRDCIEYNWFRN